MAREDSQNQKERFFDEDWDRSWHFRRHDHEHGGSFVFGALLIVGGSLFLLNVLGIVNWDVWNHIWAFWPVLLILLGAHLMLEREPELHGLMQVITLVVLILIALYAVRAVNPTIHYYPPLDNFLDKLGQVDRMKGVQTHLRVAQ